MKKLLMMASAVFLASGAIIAHADDHGSKTYALDGFSGVKASAGINVTFEQSDDYSVTAHFENADADDVKIRVDGDVLKISYKNSNGWQTKGRKVKVAVTGPDLELARATSGASLRVGAVNVGDIKLKADSGGSLKISGSCGAVTGGVSSGGSVNAKALKCKSVDVDASSGGSFNGYGSDYGKGNSSSGGSIVIYGNPETQKKNKSWSGGSVSFR